MFGTQFDGINVSAFNPDIGNGVLKTDVGRNGYRANLIYSAEPLTITGLTNLKNYYSVIESEVNEQGLPENTSYITGRLNSEKFAGNDGCDYLEVSYKVIKTNGDHNTNYKFYTGLYYLHCAPLGSE